MSGQDLAEEINRVGLGAGGVGAAREAHRGKISAESLADCFIGIHKRIIPLSVLRL